MITYYFMGHSIVVQPAEGGKGQLAIIYDANENPIASAYINSSQEDIVKKAQQEILKLKYTKS